MDSFSSPESNCSVFKLIEAVKFRPALWDSTYGKFKKKISIRDKVWQGVFKELDPNYRLRSEKEQLAIAIKITTKWRNIRDAFIRSLKKRATDPKMKKYMYHDHLSFMLKLYKSYLRPESPGPLQLDNSFNQNLMSYHEHKAQPSISFNNIAENSLDKKPKIFVSIEEESLDDNDEEELTNDGKEEYSSSKNIVTDFCDAYNMTNCLKNQAEQIENETTQLQNSQDNNPIEIGLNQSNCERHLENVAILLPDEDEAFVSSILSLLRDMSLDEKLEFRIAVLQKISHIRSKRHNKI